VVLGARVRGMLQAWVLLGAVVAGALTLAWRWGDEHTWWIELLRYVPYPVWLLPAASGLLLAFWLRPLWRWLALVSVVLVLGPVMGLSLGQGRATAGDAVGKQPLRVMTYNIKAYRARWLDGAFDAIAEEIVRRAPDVLVMQDAGQMFWRGRPVPQLMPALAPYRLKAVDQYVVASRLPLRDCQTGDMPIGSTAHPYLRCTVMVGTRAVTVVTAHTLTPREGLNAARSEAMGGLDDWQQNFAGRMAQARQLAAAVQALPRPLILAGDLNATQASPVLQVLLDAGLTIGVTQAGIGWGFTIGHALKPHVSFLRIDHILVSADIAVVRAVAGSRWGSEHRPVIADLLVPR